MLLQESSLSLSLSRLVQLMLSSLTYSGLREDSGEPNWSSWSRLATTRRSSGGSHTQARGGGAAAVGGADVAPPETAGLTQWAGPDAVVAAAVAAAELVLHSFFASPHASSFSSRCLVASFLAYLAASAAGVAVLQYKLVSTFPPTVLYRVAAINPEHFQCFIIAIKNNLFCKFFLSKPSQLSGET